MKINDYGRVNATSAYRNQLAPRDADTVKKSGRKDEVNISPEAMELLKARSGTEPDPARAEMISRLKHDVDAGSYRVEAERIAERLLPYLTE